MDLAPENKLGLYFLSAPTAPACFLQVKKSFSEAGTVELKSDVSMDDLQFEVKSGKKCVAILTIGDRNDLAVIVNGLFALKKDIRDHKLMVVVFLKFASDKVEDLLMRSGCGEILKFDVNARAFAYKINRYLKLLDQEEIVPDAMVSLVGDKNAHPIQDAAKKLGSRAQSGSAGNGHVHTTTAWTGTNDFWLFRKKGYAKKYLDQWLIEIIGPSPAAGFWEKIAEQHWQWRARPEFDFFDVTPGNWEFMGNEPQYSWVINRWAFISKNPSLGLVNRSHIVYSRFHLRDENNLEVPQNSEFARSIFQKIKDTYDRDYLMKGETAGLKDLLGKSEHNPEIPWADKTNSKDLSAADWNIHDLESDDEREWGDDEGEGGFLLGADAMADCGVSGRIKDHAVDLLEFNEALSTFSIGIHGSLIEAKELVEITIAAENLNLPKSLVLTGVIVQIGEIDDSGRAVADMLMLQGSKDEFKKIRDAIHRRQTEVLAFFKKARGLD